jgi:dipeptidyl aminopeptidase/acylaminoacyl peptidase
MVLPHSGPESNDVFSLSPLTRIFSGVGYVVLQPEYRGSTGYGTDFLGHVSVIPRAGDEFEGGNL